MATFPVTIGESTAGPNYAAANAEAVLVIVGTATSGDFNKPVVCRNDAQPAETFTSGRLVEVASIVIGEGQQPAILVRASSATAGAYGTLVTSGVTGTSVVTTDATAIPIQDGVAAFRIVVGGTRGTPGITYQTSPNNLDWSEIKALGTATQIDEPFTGARFLLAAGTLVANDTASVPTSAPKTNAAGLTSALTSLLTYQGHPFGGIVVVGSIDDTGSWTAVINALSGLEQRQRSCLAILEARAPNSGESESAYRTALETDWSARRDNRVGVVAGVGRYNPTEVAQCRYRLKRSMLGPLAARHVGLSYEQSHGLVTRMARATGTPSIFGGPIRGFSIYDESSQPIGHNEAADPGLKDLKFIVATTYPQEGNDAFCDTPVTRAPDGDTVTILPIRRMTNVCKRIAYYELTRRIGSYALLETGKTTMAPEVAADLDNNVRAALRAELNGRATIMFNIDVPGTDMSVAAPRVKWNASLKTGRWISGWDGVLEINK